MGVEVDVLDVYGWIFLMFVVKMGVFDLIWMFFELNVDIN